MSNKELLIESIEDEIKTLNDLIRIFKPLMTKDPLVMSVLADVYDEIDERIGYKQSELRDFKNPEI